MRREDGVDIGEMLVELVVLGVRTWKVESIEYQS